jgi:hypothetical protein
MSKDVIQIRVFVKIGGFAGRHGKIDWFGTNPPAENAHAFAHFIGIQAVLFLSKMLSKELPLRSQCKI